MKDLEQTSFSDFAVDRRHKLRKYKLREQSHTQSLSSDVARRMKLKKELSDFVKKSPDCRSINNISWKDYFDTVNQSLEEWSSVKASVETLADRFQDLYHEYGGSFLKRSHALHDCGSHIVYGSRGEIVYINGCRDRLCPSCNRRHARQTLRELKLIVDIVTQDELDREVPASERSQFFMLSLTVPSCPGIMLKDTLDNALKSFASFSSNRWYRQAVRGSYRTTEITYNSEKKSFHPHFHLFLQLDPQLIISDPHWQFSNLQREWTRYCGYTYVDNGPEVYEYDFNYTACSVEDSSDASGCSYSYFIRPDEDPVTVAREQFGIQEPVILSQGVYRTRSKVTYKRINSPTDFSTVLYELDDFLGREVVSQRNLLQIDFHRFVDFKNKSGVEELCKYISKEIFHPELFALDDLFCFAVSVKGVRLYSYSKSFTKLLADYHAGLYDEKYHKIDLLQASELEVADELNKMQNGLKKHRDELMLHMLFFVHTLYSRKYSVRVERNRSGSYYYRRTYQSKGVYSYVAHSSLSRPFVRYVPGAQQLPMSERDRFQRWKKSLLNKLKEG